ncbi:sugar-binding protein [Paenibacillus sp. HB172176]|uniref:sugar-binding protein n=1 Tax=Paenibacillus sp. HB172176 TaxID=2493690 RepID=UPI00143C403F|nr:sugar-binding protein [Paenibacillus sp. HB172176]
MEIAREAVYSWETFKQELSLHRHIPMLEVNAKEITTDGMPADWSVHSGIRIPTNDSQIIMKDWGGESDLSAEFRVAYDDEYFYWTANVRDDIHASIEGSDMWRGDSIQIAFSENGKYGPDFGINHTAGGARICQWKEGNALQGLETIEARTNRSGDMTSYEMKLPWTAIFPKPPDQDHMTFALLINDNDGSRRRGWVEWTPGCGRDKDPERHGILHFVPTRNPWTLWAEGSEELRPHEQSVYTLYALNLSDEAETFILKSEQLEFSREVTIAKRSIFVGEYALSLPAPGNYSLDFRLTDSNGVSKNACSEVIVPYSMEEIDEAMNAIAVKLPSLERLIKQAEAKGIPTDYERINAAVIRDFMAYGREDARQGRYQRANYVIQELEGLYAEASRSLYAYLAGERRAKAVPRYRTGRPEIRGSAFHGRTTELSSGSIETRPVFFNGYGHFEQVRNDLHKFQELGANIIQIEIGPRDIIFPRDEPGSSAMKQRSGVQANPDYIISTSAVESDIVEVLKKAGEHHVAVNLLLSPHYFPEWALQQWPELKSNASHSLRFRIDHPIAREIVGDYLRAAIPLVKDYPSLHSVTLTNEPVYRTNQVPCYLPVWQQFLQELYGGDIGELNRVYSSNYAAFREVPMPSGVVPEPFAYDWIVFNQKLFADWHAWMADIIRRCAPELPVHVKIMGDRTGCLGWGIDIEVFSRMSQINGNDNWSYLGEGARGYLQEMSFYDLQVSLNKAPVFNSEHHVIPDGDRRYIPGQADHARTVLWQGALHGKSASTLWVWERTYDPRSDTEGSVLHRPDVVAAIGVVNHDLNRLSWEVAAFQQAIAHVAILYATPSDLYSAVYGKMLMNVYEAVSFGGEKVGFISEEQIARGGAQEFSIIVVPSATHVHPLTLSGLNTYAKRGGTVVIIGQDALRLDAHLYTLSQEERTSLYTSAIVIPSESASAIQIWSCLLPLLENAGLSELRMIDCASGQEVAGVIWRKAEYKGRRLISAVNISEEPKQVSMLWNGKQIRIAKELIEDTVVDTDRIELNPLTPGLYDIGEHKGVVL